jgi:hypothetical protein
MTVARGISPRRFLLANAVILSLVGACLVQIAIGGDFWPLSGYRMFSTADADSVYSRIELIGVPRGESEEILLLADHRVLRPFDRSRLRSALERMRAAEDSEARLARAARDILRRYHAAGEAPLAELRIEEIQWRTDRRGKVEVLRRERLATAVARE